MATINRTLPFAKEFGWTDQTNEKLGDVDHEGITSLHKQNEIDIQLCECHRCIRFKLRKKVAEQEAELDRFLRPEERAALNTEVLKETDRARTKARIRGLYV